MYGISSFGSISIALNGSQGAYINTDKLRDGDTITAAGNTDSVRPFTSQLLSDSKIDFVNVSTGIELTYDQAASASAVKLTANTNIILNDTTANIQNHLSEIFGMSKLLSIHSTENLAPIAISASQATSSNMAKLSPDNLVKLNIFAGDTINTALLNIDKLDIGDKNFFFWTKGSSAADVTSNNAKWSFTANVGGDNTADIFTYRDQSTSQVQTVKLTGVTDMTLEGGGVFKLTLDAV